MAGFVLTQAAKTDLKAIARYTQDTWGIEQRNRYLTMIDACFHALADNPSLGSDCGDIRTGYRKRGVGKHVVFYRQIESDLIEIVRVLHGRMDLAAKLTAPASI